MKKQPAKKQPAKKQPAKKQPAKKQPAKKQRLGPWQKAWIKSLETGGWTQGRNALCFKTRDGDWQMCCLGVACELLIQNGVRLDAVFQGYGYANSHVSYSGSTYTAPAKVVEKLGLRSRTGDLKGYVTLKGACSLSGANDSGCTFKEIAEFVRKNPHVVFVEPR